MVMSLQNAVQTTSQGVSVGYLTKADYAALSEASVGKVLRCYSQRSVAMRYLEVYNEALAYKNFRL